LFTAASSKQILFDLWLANRVRRSPEH